VELETELVVIANCAVVAPDATVTLGGTDATAAFELERVTASPPLRAAIVSVTVPVAPVPPTTLVGLIETDDKLGAAGAAWTVNRRLLENGPVAPAELTPRTPEELLHGQAADRRLRHAHHLADCQRVGEVARVVDLDDVTGCIGRVAPVEGHRL
jgi:hypothetical protein